MKNITASLLLLVGFTAFSQQESTASPANGQIKVEANTPSNSNQVKPEKIQPADIDREKIIIRDGRKNKAKKQNNN